MADRTLTFNAASNVTVTTSWDIFQINNTIQNSYINAGRGSTYFAISGLTLGTGESIKKVILSSQYTQSGTSDSSARFTMNGALYATSKRIDPSEIQNNTNFTVQFYLRASGSAGSPGSTASPNSYSMTRTITNMVLTITIGEGSEFDGKVSSLPDGAKIIITEASGNALYTLVQHNYNTDKALIWRDDSVGTSKWRNTAPSSASGNKFANSNLDSYIINTWYPTLPSNTTQFLQTIDYPIRESAASGSASISINRQASTISAIETGLGGSEGFGSPLDYATTVNGGAAYWTREPVMGEASYAKRVNNSGVMGNASVTNAMGVRPTLGVLEDQLVIYSESDGAYVFCSQCIAPSHLYIDGEETNVVNLNSDVNMTLSWSDGAEGYNSAIAGYAVWYSTSEDGTYELYGSTTSNSMIIVGPKRGYQTYYFKVQTIAPDDIDYCSSDLSSVVRSTSTKESNVYYYDGATWKIAMPKHYNGSAWTVTKGAAYYNGTQWVAPDN